MNHSGNASFFFFLDLFIRMSLHVSAGACGGQQWALLILAGAVTDSSHPLWVLESEL